MLVKRGIAESIILTIITCGIYGIIWMISLSNELSEHNRENIEGGMEFLLIIVTCGLYSFYWMYKMGKKITRAQAIRGRYIEDNSLLYVILAIFQLSIVSLAIMQSQVNDIA